MGVGARDGRGARRADLGVERARRRGSTWGRGLVIPVPMKRTLILALVSLALVGCKGRKDSADGGESSGGGGLFGGLSFLGPKPFEGEIELEIDDKRDSKPGRTIIYQVKQPKMRFDVPADPASPGLSKGAWVLVDPPQKKAYMVVDAEKRALVLDFDKMKEQGKQMGGGGGTTVSPSGGPSKPPPKITKTGKEDKVAGYSCEIWIIEEDAKKAEVCAAKGITWFDATAMGGGYKEAWMLQMTDANHFPLRIVSSDALGEASRMEAKRIEKKTLDESRFKVPEGYQVMDLSALLGGLGMGAGTAGRPGIPGLGSGAPPGYPSNLPPGLPTAKAGGGRKAFPQ